MQIEDIKNPVEVTVYILAETEMAFKVSDEDVHEYDFDKAKWLPKSQIHLEKDAGRGDFAIITMPEWLAKEKEFI